MESTKLSFPIEVLSQFEKGLDTCFGAYCRGDSAAVLSGNFQQLLGDMLFEYFKYKVGQQVGEPVDFTFLDGIHGHLTLVHLPKGETPPPVPVKPIAEATQPHPVTVNPQYSGLVRKNPPRPMNCWLLYRDEMHKKLKDEQPHLTVQQISTICSQNWRDLASAEKELWKAKARAAKEEHQRQFPDYKYAPRRPGQKKKRQSRKASKSVAVSSIASPEAFDFNGTQEFASMTQNTDVTTVTESENANDSANLILRGNASLMSTNTEMMGQASQDLGLTFFNPDAEVERQVRLEAEFENGPTPSVFGEDSFAFHSGAHEDLILPSFYMNGF